MNLSPETKIYEEAADKLRKSMKGLGTDDPLLIETTMKFSKAERQKIKVTYKAAYGRDLIKDIEGDTSFNYKNTLVALYEDPIEYDAKNLYHAMHGLGTDDDALIEIVCTKTNEQLKLIKDKFQELFKKDLVKYVEGDTSGNYKKFLVSLLQCNRNDNTQPNEEQCKAWAEELFKAGEAKLGTDEATFNKIFAVRSPAELKSINNWYNKLYGHPLVTAVDKEFSGHIKESLKTAIMYMVNPATYFATKVYKAVKGLGTDDKTLIRVLVSREEIDIPQMSEQYMTITGKCMREDVKDDTSGNYRKTLLALIDKQINKS